MDVRGQGGDGEVKSLRHSNTSKEADEGKGDSRGGESLFIRKWIFPPRIIKSLQECVGASTVILATQNRLFVRPGGGSAYGKGVPHPSDRDSKEEGYMIRLMATVIYDINHFSQTLRSKLSNLAASYLLLIKTHPFNFHLLKGLLVSLGYRRTNIMEMKMTWNKSKLQSVKMNLCILINGP